MCSYKMMGSVRNLHIVLFIGVMCVVQTIVPNCPYSHPDCPDCLNTRVICWNLSQIPPLNTGPNVFSVKQVDFASGNITSISKNSLPSGIEALNIYSNPLTNISEDAFEASAATLQFIEFAKAKFNSLPRALMRLTNLSRLSIEFTNLTVYDTDLLKNITPNIRELELRGVGLSSWPSFISECHLLSALALNSNSLKSIPHDAFISNKKLITDLYLDGNYLTQVAQAISKLPNLEILDLNFNNLSDFIELQQIAGSSFVEKLQDLRLASNGITRMANFSGFSKLKHIFLQQNKLSDIPAGLLPLYLIELNLAENRLSSVPTDIASMSELFVLELNGNLITQIEPDSFPPSMEFLDLKYNNITVITNSTFRNLEKLFSLNLRSNPITKIASAAFSELSSLFYLDISGSQVTEFPIAITILTSKKVTVRFSTNKEMFCPCPQPSNIIELYMTRRYLDPKLMDGSCTSGQLVIDYLSDPCREASTST